MPFVEAPDRNRRIGSSRFLYLRCEKCRLIRIEAVPGNLSAYYPAEYHTFPTRQRLEYLGARDRSKIETVSKFVRTGRLLEIGPAHGAFAFQASQAGFDVDTIEMDESCCTYLRDVVGVHAICSDSPETSMQSLGEYGVVALWHVIEHLVNPWEVLRQAAARCASGGILVIAAPNPEAWQFRVMKSYWPHLDAPRHLYLFPRLLLRNYLAPLGLRAVHDTTSDADARQWNRFGWQRLLMNQVEGNTLRRLAYVAGSVYSLATAPIESRESSGSTYTLVFQKEHA